MDKKVYEKISEQLGEMILEWRKCRWCGEEFAVYEGDKKLLDKISFNYGDNKIKLSLPDLCIKCSKRNLEIFRNERKLYKRKCKNCGKAEPAVVGDESLNVVCYDCWLKENYLDYGMDLEDETKFLDSLRKLYKKAPWLTRLVMRMENSPYCNQETDDKNCYMNVGGHYNENSYYNTYAIHSKNVVDNYRVIESEIVYNSIDVVKSFKVFFSSNVKNSSHVFFSEDVQGSNYVWMSVGVYNKSYVWKNEVVSKEQWIENFEKEKERLKTYSGYLQLLKEFNQIRNNSIKKSLYNLNVSNSIGNFLVNVKNTVLSTVGEDSEDVRWADIFAGIKNSFNIESAGWVEQCLNIISSINAKRTINSFAVFEGSELIYDTYSKGNHNKVLGGIGLDTGNDYIILNKKYDSSQWNEKVKNILKHLTDKKILNRFMLPILSPFPYNDTVAIEYYPIREIKGVRLEGEEMKGLIEKLFEEGKIEGEEASKLRVYLKERITKEEVYDKEGEGIVYVLELDKFISRAILDLGGEELIAIKWRTKEKEVNVPEGIELIKAEELPDDISKMTKEEELRILKGAIICEESGRPFRVIKPELEFYKKYGIALPRKHPDIRHKERLKLRPKRELYLRRCDKCGKEILSVYSEDVEFKVYCQECYDKEFI